ncbi:MAG TPA: amidohydrolase family protein, partial [Vicinamibacterales bacterium]|nr:amidohydrolase family protein [Vicinamibacterales bacterium]
MRRIALVALAAFAAVAAALRPSPQSIPADTILVNGHIVTVDARFSVAQAIAIANGKFTAVGADADIRKLAGPQTTVIDLKGQTVTPGLADDHLHDAGGGPGVDLSRARSMADVLAAVAARVKSSQPGDVVVSNSDWHEAQLTEHRLPYRKDLDAVSPRNPVVLVRGGHEYIL